MIFKMMNESDIRSALEGQENILEKEAKENERFFKSLTCPSCGAGVLPIIDARKPFKEGQILPNYLAKCRQCEAEFEPYTKIQITLGSH